MSPCLKRLDADCFRAHPAWAKQAFAYRLVHLLTPRRLTKRLPKGLRRGLIAPGVIIPPGVDVPAGMILSPGATLPAGWTAGDPLPAGITIAPGTAFPPGWHPGDPVPPGVIIAPGAFFPPGWLPGDPLPDGVFYAPTYPLGVDATGATPPTYTEVFAPGPVSTAPPGGAVATPPWFTEPFDSLDPAIWTHYTYRTGLSSIESGRLKQFGGTAGGYAAVWGADDATIPDAFDLTFEMNHSSGTGSVTHMVHLGADQINLRFDHPTTLNVLESTGWTAITIDTIAGTTDTWKVSYNGTTMDIYRNDAEIRTGLTLRVWAGNKGRRIIHTAAISVVYHDDYTITPI